MKKIIKNKYANFYINAALELGLNFEILNQEIGLIRIFNEKKELYISSNVLGVNTQISSSLSVNKVKTSILLREKNIPVPHHRAFKDKDSAIRYSSAQLLLNKYVVIKPISGSLSFGITVKPSTGLQIKEAVGEAFEGNTNIMVEEYIPGRHYRITILDDEIIAVTERIGSYIIGNGKDSISELIKTKNIERKKRELPLIMLRKKDLDFINSMSLELTDIVPEGKKVILQLGCDLDIGGERVRIDRDEIPKENLDLFRFAAKTLNLRFAGVDYISPDIMVPFSTIRTAINEINSAPDSDVHFRDSYPNDNYAAVRILENVFGPNFKLSKEIPDVTPIPHYIHPILEASDPSLIN